MSSCENTAFPSARTEFNYPLPGAQTKTTVTSAADFHAVIVLTTLGADTDASSLARTLVEECLAACVNVLPPMSSTYRWKGAVEQEREQQLVIKTTAARLPALEARLRDLHPYELPEFLVLTVAAGSEAYLRWVAESTTPAC
jgi:periplasmic divalent cation tolerance protein